MITTDISPVATPAPTEHPAPLTLCECCMLLLVNDDSSQCRDFHGHTHEGMKVPDGTALISMTPRTNDAPRPMRCDGHGGDITVMAPYWVALAPAEHDDDLVSWTVTWTIDQEAATPAEAAAAVWREIFGRWHATDGDACVFEVTDPATGKVHEIDLSNDMPATR